MQEKEKLRLLLANAELSRPQDAPGFWLWRAAHFYQREVDRAMTPLGLTHLQFVILVEIAWFGSRQDEVRQKDLVSLGTIHMAQVSALIKTLQKNRLVEQTKSVGDGRSRTLRLTDEGIEALHKAIPAMTEVQRRLFGGSPMTEPSPISSIKDLLDQWS